MLMIVVFGLTASPVLAAPKFLLEGVKCAVGGAQAPANVPGQPASTEFIASVPCGLCDFIQVFVNAANMLVAFSGAIAILMFIYAGILYLSTSFKPEYGKQAKEIMKTTIIGLAFIFGAYTIMNFVILTLVGGTPGLSVLGGKTLTNQGSRGWGVCAGYETSVPATK